MAGHILLSNAIVVRDRCVLLVATRYAGRTEPLWNLPGGRQNAGELLSETCLRELREETSLDGVVGELAYLSESYDAEGTHFVASIFRVDVETYASSKGARIENLAWVAFDRLAEYLVVPIVRDPLIAWTSGIHRQRYLAVHDAGIVLRWD